MRSPDPPLPATVWNFVIGNNETALSAATAKAAELGYATRSLGSHNQGEARDVGRDLAQLIRPLRDSGAATSGPLCVLGGGETTVRLAPTNQLRRGGRNQELVLGAVDELWDDGLRQVAVLSGGTDGEDGPTDAAGAVADAELIRTARELGLSPEPFLAINNSYEFFERTGGLIKTGPTHTNVMDVWVALIASASGLARILSSTERIARPPRISPPPIQVENPTGSPHRQYTHSGFRIGSNSVKSAAS